MNDKSDVRLVDAHTKGNRGTHHTHSILYQVVFIETTAIPKEN
jgi:hypothetical protein